MVASHLAGQYDAVARKLEIGMGEVVDGKKYGGHEKSQSALINILLV